MEVMDYFLANRSNPNGCSPKSTYFTSLAYTNYSMVTDWCAPAFLLAKLPDLTFNSRRYVAGNEIADHTMTHAGKPNTSEIYGNLRALNAFAGSASRLICLIDLRDGRLCRSTPGRPDRRAQLTNMSLAVPMTDLTGFRAPMLSWNGDTLTHLYNASFKVRWPSLCASSRISRSFLFLSP